MIRVVIENLVVFFLPTLVYVAWVMLTRKGETSGRAVLVEAPLVWLSVAGAALVVITMLAFGTTGGGKPGQGYVPPSVDKDGRIIPGHFK